MRTYLFRFALYSIFVCFSFAAPNLAMASSPPSAGDEGRVCGVIDWQPDNRRYARTLANLDIGEPRTVRLIYFLPNDQYFRPEVVQRMKDEIRRIQAFFAEQMGAHGYGEKTFSIETDPQGDPLVHRVNGQQPNWYYHSDVAGNTLSEIEQVFDLNANIYLIVFDNHRERIGSLFGVLGYGIRYNKNAGYALLPGEFTFETTAHELGHAFGLQHDFHDNAYIMSYGPGERRLSACSAEFLVVHPYFNPDVPIVDSSYSTMELISSPQYPPGAASVSVQLGVSAPDGLHQILLFARTEKPHEAARFLEIVSCHGLMGEKNAVAQFDYDGIKPSRGLGSLADSAIHTIFVDIVDIHGDVTKRNFRLFETFSGHIDTIHAPEPLSSEWHDLSFSPDGSLLALGAILLDVKTGTTIAVFEDVTSIAFSPDEKILASGSFNFWVKLWDVATQTNIVTLEGHQPTVGPVAFSLDGKILAAGSGDTTIKLWDVETRTNIATLEGHEHKIRSVVFSPDGKTLASGSIDSTVRLWDVESQTNTATLEGHYGWVTSVVFSPDGMTLASAGDKTIKLWNVGTEKMTATLGGHKAFVESVAFSPDGLVLASGSADATVKLWDVMSWANFATLVHPEWVKSVAFSSDGTTLACAMRNNTIELWNTSQWVKLRNQAVPDPNLRTALQIALDKEAEIPIKPADLASLANFLAPEASITALVGLEFATNLESLSVYENSISSLAPLAELINLKSLSLGKNNITDILPLAGLTNLIDLILYNNISDLLPLRGLTNLTTLFLSNNSISDISTIAALTNLESLDLPGNKISDISALSDLTNLTVLHLAVNSISDISPLVANTGLGEGDRLFLKRNPLSYDAINTHIPILQGRGVTVSFNDRTPTTLQIISGDDQVGFLSEPPANPFVVEVRDEHGAVFEGVPVTFAIADGGGMLSTTETTTDAEGRAESILTLGQNREVNTVQVSAAEIEETVTFNAVVKKTEFDLYVPAGISLIHVPLSVTSADGADTSVMTIGDLYDALGGAGAVNVLITRDSASQQWRSYFRTADRGTAGDRKLTNYLGIIAVMQNAVTLRLAGDALGEDGRSSIMLQPGTNLVGVPLRDSRITRVSNLFALEGIRDNVTAVIVSDNREFKVVGRAGDDGDIPVTGGQSFVLTARKAATVVISGEAWENVSATAAAPLTDLSGVKVSDTTPVLALSGSIVDEGTSLNKAGFQVTVKNFSTGKVLTTKTHKDSFQLEGHGFQLTIVEVESGRAAKTGDILEISVQSAEPLIGAKPLRYTVTPSDVSNSQIQLPELVAYEIPAETALLPNFPNPFNPETWISYRLAKDAFVTLAIYDLSGRLVRGIELGHQMAAVYESRDKAAYWNGKNDIGEQVASGVYFYTLTAGDYTATRRMVILK